MSRIIINDSDNMLTTKERAEIAKWERAKEASSWERSPPCSNPHMTTAYSMAAIMQSNI